MSPIRQGQYRAKRLVDLTVLAVVAVPTAIVGLVCALAVKLTSRGPLFFRQQRVGQGGRPLDILKFRTMVDDPEGNPVFPESDRITSAGRWLRRYSLDELPQLVNVLRGDMSAVGPRPTLAYQVERYSPTQRRRLLVKPGLTGLAQVRGRNAIGWKERIGYDLEYVDRQSLWLDLRILAETLPAVLRGSGVSGHPVDDPLASPVGAGDRPRG